MRLDAELEPPGRKPRQPARALRAERRAVVTADRARQAVSLEGARENRPRALNRRLGDARLDQKPRMAVGDRQRVDPALVLGAKPALEVGRPFLVGRLGRDRPRRRIERPASALDRFNEPGPLKNVADRRSCRPILVRGPRRELHQKLARAEMGKSPPQRHDLPCDRLRRAMRTGARRVRTIEEPVRRAARPPSPPSIKRVPAHPIAPTQIRHAPMARVVIRQHPNPLLHPTSLRKRHRKSSFRPSLTCQPSTQSKLSEIYPVHTTARPPTLSRPRKEGGDAPPRQACKINALPGSFSPCIR